MMSYKYDTCMKNTRIHILNLILQLKYLLYSSIRCTVMSWFFFLGWITEFARISFPQNSKLHLDYEKVPHISQGNHTKAAALDSC